MREEDSSCLLPPVSSEGENIIDASDSIESSVSASLSIKLISNFIIIVDWMFNLMGNICFDKLSF
jgi:hypothetical protein